ASAENLATFEADPETYAPQYGGYCAYAVSLNHTASTDPDAWAIHGDKLYLNYNKMVRTLWSGDIKGNIRKGDDNWPGVLE
ncbi:MAG: YHS domain protein, partial [Rhodobacteraceae bacterium]|nr:YHS domain protein [Paracoccaceae bacterium]